MTPEQAAVYVQAQTVSAQIRLAAMVAENRQRDINGHSLAYDEASFMKLEHEFCIGHNAVMGLFIQANN